MAGFRLVQRDGEDTLHRWPALEQCNLDDTERDTALDIGPEEAAKLIEGGTVHACKHCRPLDADDASDDD
jgi:hypothetical protein